MQEACNSVSVIVSLNSDPATYAASRLHMPIIVSSAYMTSAMSLLLAWSNVFRSSGERSFTIFCWRSSALVVRGAEAGALF